jgi:hypothetical protein
MAKTATATTAFSYLISDQTEKGTLDAIVVPPVDIKGANYQPRSMQLVQQHQHLQEPTNSKKQKVKICCLHMLNIVWYHHYITHHTPAPVNEGSVYRHVGGNVNGVKPFGAQEELITAFSNMRGIKARGCSLIETNAAWKRCEYRRNTEALLRKTFGSVRAEFSTSDKTVEDTNFKPGETMSAVLGKWANLVI